MLQILRNQQMWFELVGVFEWAGKDSSPSVTTNLFLNQNRAYQLHFFFIYPLAPHTSKCSPSCEGYNAHQWRRHSVLQHLRWPAGHVTQDAVVEEYVLLAVCVYRELGDAGGVVVDHHDAGAVETLGLVHKQVAALIVHVVGDDEALWK